MYSNCFKTLKKNSLFFPHRCCCRNLINNWTTCASVFHVVFLLVSSKARRHFYWKPEPRRLLTEEEFREQGEEETRRALEELRRHCNSPEFSPWKMVSKLQSPQRWLQRLHYTHKMCISSLALCFLVENIPRFFFFYTKYLTLTDTGSVCDLYLNF